MRWEHLIDGMGRYKKILELGEGHAHSTPPLWETLKWDQIRRKLQILKKSLIENFIFCEVVVSRKIMLSEVCIVPHAIFVTLTIKLCNESYYENNLLGAGGLKQNFYLWK